MFSCSLLFCFAFQFLGIVRYDDKTKEEICVLANILMKQNCCLLLLFINISKIKIKMKFLALFICSFLDCSIENFVRQKQNQIVVHLGFSIDST
jgi:hypothetical protein